MIEGHTHQFTEVLYDDKRGTELRCQCGARLWEPPATSLWEAFPGERPKETDAEIHARSLKRR